jgi:hypothetical protein
MQEDRCQGKGISKDHLTLRLTYLYRMGSNKNFEVGEYALQKIWLCSETDGTPDHGIAAEAIL